MASLSYPPGSRLPAAVQTALWLRDPVGHIERCRKRYGSIFTVRFVGFAPYVYVTDPSLVREVYATDRTIGRAGDARRDMLKPLVGENSLLITEDDQWLRHRKLLGPVFHRNHVDGYANEIAAIASDEIDRWPLGEPVALRDRMQAITLEVILRLVFGISDERRRQRFRELLPRLVEGGGPLLLWLLPPTLLERKRSSLLLRSLPSPVRSFFATREEVDRLIFDEISERRAQPQGSETRDVLALLLAARDEQGRGMSDVELRDELITLLEAGHETTATALAWTFERLTRHPRAMSTLTEEVDAGGSEYLKATVREALRSRPVVPDTPRLLTGPLELDGYQIPQGWLVAAAITSVQLDRAATAEPEAFRPERFLDQPPRTGWIPFGGGKRHCVGSHLALLEMEVVIAEVVRRLSLDPTTSRPEKARVHHVTIAPSEGAMVIAHPRVGAARTITA